MYDVVTEKIQCPYCGEIIELLVDGSEPEQEYVEDCEVCCQPISMRVSVEEGGDVYVDAHRENE